MRDYSIGTVVFDDVSKRYRLGTAGTLRGTLAALIRGDYRRKGAHDLWALKDVSFLVEPGGALGLIGPNGAGKTTTLKLLSHITRPTSGRIAVSGRVSSLIELGAGFHPELTGRENIYLNGAILGLRRREIASKLDRIIDFSGLGEFIDTPVKRYSSGMYVRLGFAVAAHVEPDVLLVDEVLAVGDASFRHRCMQHIHQLRRNGTTVVFVSHNMHLVNSICDTALLIVQGQVRAEGDTATVISEYERVVRQGDGVGGSEGDADERSQPSACGAVMADLEVRSLDGQNDELVCHHPALMRVRYKAAGAVPIGRLALFIVRERDHVTCMSAESDCVRDADFELRELDGEGVIDVVFDPLQLAPGRYYAVAKVTDVSNSLVIASTRRRRFDVQVGRYRVSEGVFVPSLSWQHRPAQ